MYYEPRRSIAQSENLTSMSNSRYNTKENVNQMSQGRFGDFLKNDNL